MIFINPFVMAATRDEAVSWLMHRMIFGLLRNPTAVPHRLIGLKMA